MAEAPPKARPGKKDKPPRTPRDFNEIVRQADAKAIKLFDLINDQTRSQFEFAILLHKTLVGVALIVLVVSVGIVFFPTTNSYLQTFSLIGTPASLLTLVIASLRNPVTQQYQTFERIFRLNVIFLDFIHRIRNSSLLLEQTLAKISAEEFAKLYAQMKDFESIAEETLENLK